MSFSPFDQSDFDSMKSVRPKKHIETLKAKTEALRKALAGFPEFELNFFKHRIARRPKMRGRQGLVFGPARWDDQHWYLSTWVEIKTKSIMIGRQIAPKPPAFQVFQTFLGVRPPLPFRNALLEAIANRGLHVEIQGSVESLSDPDEILARLETYHVPPNEETVFVLLGHIWKPQEAESKAASEFRSAYASIMPFYEELILASGSYYFHVG